MSKCPLIYYLKTAMDILKSFIAPLLCGFIILALISGAEWTLHYKYLEVNYMVNEYHNSSLHDLVRLFLGVALKHSYEYVLAWSSQSIIFMIVLLFCFQINGNRLYVKTDKTCYCHKTLLNECNQQNRSRILINSLLLNYHLSNVSRLTGKIITKFEEVSFSAKKIKIVNLGSNNTCTASLKSIRGNQLYYCTVQQEGSQFNTYCTWSKPFVNFCAYFRYWCTIVMKWALAKLLVLCGDIELNPGPIALDDLLDLQLLQCIKWHEYNGVEKELKMCQELASEWKTIAGMVGLSGSQIIIIEREQSAIESCTKMFEMWIDYHSSLSSKYSCNWSSLCALLSDIGKNDVQENIQHAITSYSSPGMKESNSVGSVTLKYCGAPCKLVWEEYGMELQCHQCDDIDKLDPVAVSVSAYTTGEFTFPENCKLVSGVHHITSSKPFPATVKVQHCVEHPKQLAFAVSSDESPPYKFHCMKGGEFTSKFGTLNVNKFSRFSIIWNWLFQRDEERYILYLCHSRRSEYDGFSKFWNVYFFAYRRLRLLEECMFKSIKQFEESFHHIPIDIKFEENASELKIDSPLPHELDILKYSELQMRRCDIHNYDGHSTYPPNCRLMLKTKNLSDMPFSVQFNIKGAESPMDCIVFHWPIYGITSVLSYDAELSTDDLSEVYGKLFPARSKWREIGLALHVSVDTIEAIREDSKQSDKCLREILTLWLRQTDSPKTWKELAKALKLPIVGRPDIAHTLV